MTAVALAIGTRPSQTWSSIASHDDRVYSIVIRQSPEGVWLAVSDQIPGLFVEGDTELDTRREAAEWAKELLVDNLGLDPGDPFKLVFLNASASYAR